MESVRTSTWNTIRKYVVEIPFSRSTSSAQGNQPKEANDSSSTSSTQQESAHPLPEHQSSVSECSAPESGLKAPPPTLLLQTTVSRRMTTIWHIVGDERIAADRPSVHQRCSSRSCSIWPSDRDSVLSGQADSTHTPALPFPAACRKTSLVRRPTIRKISGLDVETDGSSHDPQRNIERTVQRKERSSISTERGITDILNKRWESQLPSTDSPAASENSKPSTTTADRHTARFSQTSESGASADQATSGSKGVGNLHLQKTSTDVVRSLSVHSGSTILRRSLDDGFEATPLSPTGSTEPTRLPTVSKTIILQAPWAQPSVNTTSNELLNRLDDQRSTPLRKEPSIPPHERRDYFDSTSTSSTWHLTSLPRLGRELWNCRILNTTPTYLSADSRSSHDALTKDKARPAPLVFSEASATSQIDPTEARLPAHHLAPRRPSTIPTQPASPSSHARRSRSARLSTPRLHLFNLQRSVRDMRLPSVFSSSRRRHSPVFGPALDLGLERAQPEKALYAADVDVAAAKDAGLGVGAWRKEHFFRGAQRFVRNPFVDGTMAYFLSCGCIGLAEEGWNDWCIGGCCA